MPARGAHGPPDVRVITGAFLAVASNIQIDGTVNSRNGTTVSDSSVWCAIPVYNNAATVRGVALAAQRTIARVVVVDDGSTDADVAALLRDTGIPVLRHPRNLGKGQAILTALRHVRKQGGRFLITLDADGQHDPADIPRLAAAGAADPTAIVIGTRTLTGPNVPASSRFGMKFSDFWVRLETGVPVHDSQSGFRGYPVDLTLQLPVRGNHYDFEIDVLAKGVWAGLRIRHVPIGVTYPPRGERVSHFRPFLDNLRITHRHVLLVLRRLIPWPHRRLTPEDPDDPWGLFRHPIRFLRQIPRDRATPTELGIAAGVGVLIGTLPLYGVASVTIVYVTTRLKLNRLMALASQNLCMPPVVPFVCIETGFYLRHGYWLRELNRVTLLHQAPSRIWEWFLGALLLAPFFAVFTGAIVFGVALVAQSRLHRRRDEDQEGV